MKTVLVLSSLVSLTIAVCPANSILDSESSSCLEFVSSPLSYPDASFSCWSRGGQLVSVKDAFQNTQIMTGASKYFGGSPLFWIGASNAHNGSWQWVDYSHIKYNKWANGEPRTVGHCAEVNVNKWWAANCNDTKPFVCSAPMGNVYTTPAPTTHLPPSTCPQGWTGYGEYCYQVFPNMTAHSAECSCVDMGGHLMSIHSEDQENFAVGLIKAAGSEEAWIGLYITYDMFDQRGYEWRDDSELDYGSPPDVDYAKECVAEVYGASHFWQWDHFDCGHVMNYICERAL